jgi:hypothetical protein
VFSEQQNHPNVPSGGQAFCGQVCLMDEVQLGDSYMVLLVAGPQYLKF